MKTIFTSFFLFFLFTGIVLAQQKDQVLSKQFTDQVLKDMPENVRLELTKITNDNKDKNLKNATINSKNRLALHLTKPYKKELKGAQKSFALVQTLNDQNSSYYKEKLDSIVYYEAVLSPTYDSVVVQSAIQKMDENGYVTETIVQQLNSTSNELENAVKYKYTPDANGNLLEQITSEWNGSDWVYKTKYVREYNSQGLVTLGITYDWNGNNWINASKYQFEYTADGELISYMLYNVDENNDWIIYIKTENQYSENGTIASSNTYNTWNKTDSTWMSVGIRLYDEQGQIISEERQLFNAVAQKMIPSYKLEYQYLDDGSSIETRSAWNPDANEYYQQYQNRYKIERQYENDQIIQEDRLRYVNSNWQTDYRKVYNYDQWGNEILYEYYDSFYGDYGQIETKRIRAFSKSGQQIKLEQYHWVWDDYYGYIQTGDMFWEYTLDDKGRNLTYSRYKWDTNKEEWQIDYKDYYAYPNDGERTIKRYKLNINGYYPTYQKAYKTTLNYDDSIGKYTGLSDGEYYNIQITYNEDRRVDELIDREDGQIYEKVKCYYYPSGRDSAWIDYSYSSYLQDTLIHYIVFDYLELSSDEFEVTEFHSEYRDTIFNDYGEIIGIGSKYSIKNTFKADKLIQSISYDLNGVEHSRITFTYNPDGKIHTVLQESDSYQSKSEYTFSNDTLTISEYSKWDGQETTEWNLAYRAKLKIDVSVDKNQFQPIPAVMLDPTDGIEYAYEWHLQYDYGKILEVFDYSDDDNPEIYNISAKSVLYYSPASALQGNAIVSGYIFDETGATKSVSTTTNTKGNPIEGVAVSLCASDDDFVLATVATNANGFYEFKGVPEGNFYLKVDLEGYDQTSTHYIEVTKDAETFQNKNFAVEDGEVVSGITDLDVNIKVYPNPTSGKIRIEGLNSKNIIRIYSNLGNVVFEKVVSDIDNVIDLSKYAPGIYILEMVNNNKPINFKIIKQ